MSLTRREAMACYGGGLVLLSGLPALAQAAYPSRTIKMIVPYPAGGTTDFLGRLVADQLKAGLGATSPAPAPRLAPSRWRVPSRMAIRC